MANKVINLGEKSDNEQSTEDSLIVYRDVRMISSPSKYNAYTDGLDQESSTSQEDCMRIWNMRSRFMIEKNINVRAVMESLKNIFTWVPGERVINPEFGSNLRKMLYEQITQETEEMVVAEIRNSVSKWEPRAEIVKVINVSTVNDTEDNTIRLDIKFRVTGLDEVYTYTYEQSLDE